LNTVNRRTERADLAMLHHLVDAFMSFGGERPMHLQTLSVFLTIARNPGILQCDLEARLPIASSSVSRNVAALSARGRTGKPGLGLVRKRLSVKNPRAHELYLTTEGKALVEQLLSGDNQREGIAMAVAPVETTTRSQASTVAMWEV